MPETDLVAVRVLELRPATMRARRWLVPDQPFMQLADTIAEFELPGGLTNSFTSSLDGAEEGFENGDIAGACDKLASLIAKINAQDGKKLTTEEAAELRDSVQAIIGNY